MTLGEILIEAKELAETIAEENKPTFLIFPRMIDLVQDVQMVEWFERTRPSIWPVEVRGLVRTPPEIPCIEPLNLAGYCPGSELGKQFKQLRVLLMKAAAEADAISWKETNDTALFVMLCSLAVTTSFCMWLADRLEKKETEAEETQSC